MNTMKICPGCQKPLAEGAPDGLCPQCLMKAGLGTDADLGPESKAKSGRTASVAPSLEEVARLFPQLEILECLGCGGMGAVYKARQPRLDRLVALKILTGDREDATRDARFAERFEREARALAKLNHPNIVAMYEFGQVEGLPYFIMEYVDGLNVRQLEQARKLSPREALEIIPQICEALQFAHDEGIVHRDIKPANILLDKKGRVKIADFGIAKIMGGTPLIASDAGKLATKPGEGLTQDQILGTPDYMAPEQMKHPQTVDHRADIYSLGVVFYEMLTGELPLGKFQPPSRKVQIDVRLDEIVLHTLEKEPERRYQQASEVKTDVETIGSAGSPGRSSADARELRMPWTNLALVESRNGRRFVNWKNATLAWLLLMLAGELGLRLVALIANVQPETLQNAGMVMALVSAFVLSVPVRQALLSPPNEAETPRRHDPPPTTPGPGAKSFVWSDLSGSAWALAAIMLLVGRKVARTEPLMYSFFGVGGWCYPGRYDMLVAVCSALAVPWVLMPRLTKRGRAQGGPSGVWCESLSAAWALAAIGLLVGRKVARTEPLMYSFFGVGGWYYPGSYNLFVGLCFGLAAAWLVIPRLTQRGRTQGAAAAANVALDEKALAAVRSRVRVPAAGLMAIGLYLPFVVGSGCYPLRWYVPFGLACVLVIDCLILLGSWHMRQLKSYWPAVLAAIVSLVVAVPGLLALWDRANIPSPVSFAIALPGLPLGAFSIWALILLFRPEVQAAFNEVVRRGVSPRTGRPWPPAWAFAPVLLLSALLFALWMWKVWKSEAPENATTSRYAVSVPGGTVELVAVSEHRIAQWWRADGSPLPEVWFTNRSLACTAGPDEKVREFVLCATGFRDDVPVAIFPVRPTVGPNHSAGDIWTWVEPYFTRTDHPPGHYYLVAMSMPQAWRAMDVNVLVGTGWETIGEGKPGDSVPFSVSQLGLTGNLIFASPVEQTNQSFEMRAVLSKENTLDLRMLAIDDQGLAIAPSDLRSFDDINGTCLQAVFRDVPLRNIRRFRVQAAQYTPARFDRVCLDPQPTRKGVPAARIRL